MKMKAAEPRKRAAEPGVSQLFPSHSSRDFAARFRGSATQTPTKPSATQASLAGLNPSTPRPGVISILILPTILIHCQVNR